MKILVTGGAGYLGSALVPKLLSRGHSVRLLDVGYFGLDHLRAHRPAIDVVRQDIRRVQSDPRFLDELLEECDCVIHLAAISNDPSAELNPQLTDEVNFESTAVLAEGARARRIRFLFSSSCSIYGDAAGEIDEQGPLNPLTTYAVSKLRAERTLDELRDARWRPVVLRNGTLFGYSPRMRFDLVVNIFSLYGALYREIKVFGDGKQWRPLLHVRDCARAFVHFAERIETDGIYNVAHENLRVVDVGEILCGVLPGLRVVSVPPVDEDKRNYRVSTARMRAAGFNTRTGVAEGAEEMVEAIVSGVIPDPESIYYRNAKWLKELTNIGSAEHTQLVGLMETLARLRSTP